MNEAQLPSGLSLLRGAAFVSVSPLAAASWVLTCNPRQEGPARKSLTLRQQAG